MRRFTLTASLLLLTGCLDPQPGVLEIEVCTSCSLVADGATAAALTIRVPDGEHGPAPRKDSVSVQLELDRGVWAPIDRDAAKQRIETVDLGPSGAATVWFVPDTKPGPLVVQATLATFSESVTVELEPAPVLAVDLSVDGRGLPDGASPRMITARVDVAGAGMPSQGSTVCFELSDRVPADAFAELDATRVQVTSDSAATNLRAGASLRAVTVTARAAKDEACDQSEVSKSLSLRRSAAEVAPEALRLVADPAQFTTGARATGKVSAEVLTVPASSALDSTYYVDFEVQRTVPEGAAVGLSSQRAFFDGTLRKVEVDFEAAAGVRSFVVQARLGRRAEDQTGVGLSATATISDDGRQVGVADLALSSTPSVLTDGRFDYTITVQPQAFPNGLIGEGVWVELEVLERTPIGELASVSPDRLFFSSAGASATTTLVVSDAVSRVSISGRVYSLSSEVPLPQQPLLERQLELVRPQ